jgi:hypothetical protein
MLRINYISHTLIINLSKHNVNSDDQQSLTSPLITEHKELPMEFQYLVWDRHKKNAAVLN